VAVVSVGVDSGGVDSGAVRRAPGPFIRPPSPWPLKHPSEPLLPPGPLLPSEPLRCPRLPFAIIEPIPEPVPFDPLPLPRLPSAITAEPLGESASEPFPKSPSGITGGRPEPVRFNPLPRLPSAITAEQAATTRAVPVCSFPCGIIGTPRETQSTNGIPRFDRLRLGQGPAPKARPRSWTPCGIPVAEPLPLLRAMAVNHSPGMTMAMAAA
jgi:hypothetical protein